MKVAYAHVLVVGLCVTASCLVTENFFISTKMNWWEAWKYCRTYYKDLSYVWNDAEVAELLNVMNTNEMGWIGLFWNPYFSSWQWTNGAPLTYQKWAPGQPMYWEICVSTALGLWYNTNCNAKQPFYCAQTMREMVVVENPMTWEEALEYCRNHYKDLVSLGSEKELIVALQKAKEVQRMHYWTGLRFLDDSWLWVDGEQLANGSWSADPLPQCPAAPFRCGALSTISGSQEVRSCEERLSYICYAE